jgi:hypothetical protein
VFILISLTRIRSNKKLPDPPPAPPRRLNKNRLFLGSSSATVSAWASSSALEDKALSDDTSLSKTKHHTSPLYYYFSFCGHRRDTISRVTVNAREPRTFKHTYYTIIHVLYIYTNTDRFDTPAVLFGDLFIIIHFLRKCSQENSARARNGITVVPTKRTGGCKGIT